MKISILGTILLSFAVVDFAISQIEPSTTPDVATDDFESLPELKASEILQDAYLVGPHHKVREEVPTSSGANRYSIDSEFGIFEAEGNEMLIRRVAEINAIAKLKEISRTDAFKDALGKAAKSRLNAAKNLVTDPVNTVKSMPKGIMKFMNRAGESIKGIGKKGDSDDPDGSKAKGVIGYTDAKRKEAIKLGVDPYSSNSVLQEQLDEIAWASYAGNAAFSIGTMPIGGAAGLALTTTGVSETLQDVLREKSPADLKVMNRKSLVAMGATEQEANRLLENNAFSPTTQTAFVLNLKSLSGVTNRRAFIKAAGQTSTSEPDAIFCVQTAGLMSKLHKGELPLERIVMLGDFPIGIAKDKSVVVALQWDYAAWTPLAQRFADQVRQQGDPSATHLVAITGVVSPRLRQELEARAFRVEDRLSPGPLK